MRRLFFLTVWILAISCSSSHTDFPLSNGLPGRTQLVLRIAPRVLEGHYGLSTSAPTLGHEACFVMGLQLLNGSTCHNTFM